MSKKIFIMVLLMAVLFSLMVFFFPQIDLKISEFFYTPHQGFLLSRWYDRLYLEIFRNTLVYTSYSLIALLTIWLVASVLFKNFNPPIPRKICLFLILCFVVGPTFIVSGLLKDHWGRARPYQVQQFGGAKVFTPAWAISNQCETNCSFPSGETANVFCYLALMFVVARKKLIVGIVLTVGVLTGIERIGQGDHFFSDTIISGFIDYVAIWIIYQVMEKKYYISQCIRLPAT